MIKPWFWATYFLPAQHQVRTHKLLAARGCSTRGLCHQTNEINKLDERTGRESQESQE